MEQRDKYSEFNPQFQYEGVRAIIESPDLLPKLYKVLDQNCFSETWLKIIVGVSKEIYKSTGLVPNYKELEFKLYDKCQNDDDRQWLAETIQKIKKSNEISPSIIEEELKSFFRCRHRAAAISECFQSKEFDDNAMKKLLKKLEEASAQGEEDAVITTLDEITIEDVLMQGEEDKIPTFIPGLDEYINNGLVRGQVGLFMAATGKGKTTFAKRITHNAALNGYKSLLIYFEDIPEDMVRSDIAMISDTYPSKLKGYSTETAKKLAERYFSKDGAELIKENKKLCKMQDSITEVIDIENKIKEFINQGFRPDILVIDYFSCLKPTGKWNSKTYEAQAQTMRLIINLAAKYRMAVWVMGQTNSSGLYMNEEPNMGQWVGGKEAAHPAAIFLQLVRTGDQTLNKRADIYIHKVRGPYEATRLENVIYDNGKCIIDCTSDAREIVGTEEALRYVDERSDQNSK